MSALLNDLRYGLRSLLKTPAFTLTAVVTLALAIGGTTAIFSSLVGTLLRPLPYPESHNILAVCETSPSMAATMCNASPGNHFDWIRTSATIESFGLARSWTFQIEVDEKKLAVHGGVATPGVFPVFRTGAHIGRVFEDADIREGNTKVALLSHEFWQREFGGDPGVLGRLIPVGADTREIVGVLPPEFVIPDLEYVELWIPLWPERVDWRFWRGFSSFARLEEGATVEQARAEMAGIRDQLALEYPQTNEAWGVQVTGLRDWIVDSVRAALWMFFGAVGFVLLIACVNIANLLLARSAGRDRELAVRSALGAGRWRLARLLLGESLILGLVGGGLGIVLAFWLVQLFVGLAPSGIPRLAEIRVDGWVLAFAVLLSLFTSLLFGLAPVWSSTRVDVRESLQGGSRGSAGSARSRLRMALAMTEIALALVLLAGAGLLIRSFANLMDWEPGFDYTHVAMIRAYSSDGKYPEATQLPALYRRAREELSTLPGVVAAGAGSAVPLLGGDGSQEYFIEGRPVPPAGDRPSVWWFDADAQYFQALGLPLVRGRFFTEQDTYGTPQVAIVNQTFIRQNFPEADPLGEKVRLLMTHERSLEIVGVVGDVKPFQPSEPSKPEIYWPIMQAPRWGIMYIIRTAGDPLQLSEAVKARLLAVDPDMNLGSLRTMEQRIGVQLVEPRFRMSLLILFAVLALAISAVGVYGVVSYGVSRRTREFGIRMALGATRGHVLRLVVRRGLILAAVGVAVGLAGAFALTRLLGSFLVEVSATDPLTFAATGILLAFVTALASWIPARRAARVDPMVALRYE